MHHPTDRIAHTTALVTPVVEHWLEWKIAQWVHPMKDRSDDPSQRTVLPQSYISLLYLTMHSIHFIYVYMTLDISERGNPLRGYSFWTAARVLLYASSHRQDITYQGLCYTSCGVLAGRRYSSMGQLWGINPTTHHIPWVDSLLCSYISLIY